MTSIRPLRQAVLATLALLLCSCSRFVGDQTNINRDAASRCVRNIDAWKKDLARLEMLEGKFDLISDQIRRDYSKATPDEKIKLRARFVDVLTQTDQTETDADALFREIMRDLEYVSRDKRARARIAVVTPPCGTRKGSAPPRSSTPWMLCHPSYRSCCAWNSRLPTMCAASRCFVVPQFWPYGRFVARDWVDGKPVDTATSAGSGGCRRAGARERRRCAGRCVVESVSRTKAMRGGETGQRDISGHGNAA
jgi:hypothetical protein